MSCCYVNSFDFALKKLLSHWRTFAIFVRATSNELKDPTTHVWLHNCQKLLVWNMVVFLPITVLFADGLTPCVVMISVRRLLARFGPRISTHWGRVKIGALFQTTFSNAFPWMELYGYRLKFYLYKFVPKGPICLRRELTRVIFV